MRTPLGKVLGLGAAGEGAGHWWAQRVSAVALVPLGLWFVLSLLGLSGMAHAEVVAWLRQPWNAVLLTLFLGAMFYHSFLGLRVVIEDYLHLHWLKVATLLLLQFAYILMAAMGLYVVLRVAVGAGPL